MPEQTRIREQKPRPLPIVRNGQPKHDFLLQGVFLVLATLIVAASMATLGRLVSDQASNSITQGIAETAAASLDVMLADELAEIGPERPLTETAKHDLDTLFSAVNDARLNKLIQIRLRNPDASVLYQSQSELLDTAADGGELPAAARGRISVRLVDMPVAPVGPLGAASLPVLKVISPVHDLSSGAVIATAELYFGARNLVELEGQAERHVWVTVGTIGFAAVAALFALVNRTGRIIDVQRRELAANLAASRGLATENTQLRQQANIANERLLAQVGSDLHDGPLQLLALVILKLTARRGGVDGDDAVAIAQRAMNDLRGISAGLVLPELATLSLPDTIRLAIRRHEELVGNAVAAHIHALPPDTSPDLKVCVYRALQEGLTNAHRHGVPNSASVTATCQKDWLVVEISNEVPAAAAAKLVDQLAHRPLGLSGMRARLEAVGGELLFDKRALSARLNIRVPLQACGK